MKILNSLSQFAYYKIYPCLSKVKVDVNSLMGDGDVSSVTGVTEDINSTGNGVINIFQKFGVYFIAIAIFGVGIRLMLGSSKTVADTKTAVLPKILGALLVFASIGFVKFIATIGMGIGSDIASK